MFKQNFIKICAERGVAPTSVLRQIGLSNATFSCWTDESIPRQTTLKKIADYFGITVEELLRSDEEKVTVESFPSPSAPPPAPLSLLLPPNFYNLVEQLTLKEICEIQSIMEEKIKNRK